MLLVQSANCGLSPDLARHVKKELLVPMVYNVDVETSGAARAEVRELIESDLCRVRSDRGDVEVAKVKAKSVEVESRTGDVTCSGHIQVTKHLCHL